MIEEAFRDRYADGPTLAVRAPGRVNLIGEHIDYNGLSVLPMAIQRSVRLLARPRPDRVIRLSNVDPRYGDRVFELDPTLGADAPGDWCNYAKAAARALAEERGAARGLDVLVTSDLPAASGLSSSSALVMAIGLAVASVNRVALSTVQMAETMARAERFVGTAGGGMDQAICLGAEAGHASRLDFDPLTLTAVPFPESWRLIVASSLVPAEKSGSAQQAYNTRTRECREALRLVWAAPDVREVVGSSAEPSVRAALAAIGHDGLLTVADRVLTGPLLRRFRHVVTESRRVAAAESELRAGRLEALGALMTASHESLRDDYEVSTPRLDRLVQTALASGAAGARLTGAGFGGCMIALTDSAREDSVLAGMDAGFFEAHGKPAGGGDHLFVATPAPGASVTPFGR